jgi:purine-binding chemotaxis protein CheW
MPASSPWLLCRVRSNLCALPIEQVLEVMRPLPILPVAQAPQAVLGMCVLRGAAVPVIDLALCICGLAGEPTRFVSVRAGERRMALAVDAVSGTIVLEAERVAEVPPLLAQAAPALAAVMALDTSLLMLLQAGRVLPDAALSELTIHV